MAKVVITKLYRSESFLEELEDNENVIQNDVYGGFWGDFSSDIFGLNNYLPIVPNSQTPDLRSLLFYPDAEVSSFTVKKSFELSVEFK